MDNIGCTLKGFHAQDTFLHKSILGNVKAVERSIFNVEILTEHFTIFERKIYIRDTE